MIDRNSYEPLYQQVRRQIEEDILSGKIKIGQKLMSESEMMKYYNVGRATIRAALAELVSSGCLKKEHGIGTFCVAMPRQKSKANIDVLLNTGDKYFIPYFLAGISRVLEKRSCNLILHDTKDSNEEIMNIFNGIIKKGTDGILIQPYTGIDKPSNGMSTMIQDLKNAGIPIVTIDGRFQNIDLVGFFNDDFYGGYIATKHIIEMGHRKILGLFKKDLRDSKLREYGFTKAVSEAGLPVNVLHTVSSEYHDTLVNMVSNKLITAVVCYNDLLAIECYQLMAEHNFNIPNDLSIIGYDDTELSLTAIPQLSSITHPKDKMGEDATNCLLNMINRDYPKENIILYTPKVVKRASVKKLI